MNNEEQELDYTVSIRKKIVTAITSDENYERIVKDEDSIKILLTTLKDIDNITLTKMKIKSDNENTDKLVQSKNLITELLTSFDTKKASYTDATNPNKKSFDDSDGHRDYVNDEMSVGVSTINYDEFKQSE